MFRKYLILLFIASIGLTAFAQKVKLSGQVFDSDSTDYIPFSAVILTQNETRSFATAADIDGKFEFDSVPPGKYGLMVRHVGYEPLSDSLFICAKDSTRIKNIFLKTLIDQMEEIHLLPYFKKPVIKKKKTLP